MKYYRERNNIHIVNEGQLSGIEIYAEMVHMLVSADIRVKTHAVTKEVSWLKCKIEGCDFDAFIWETGEAVIHCDHERCMQKLEDIVDSWKGVSSCA